VKLIRYVRGLFLVFVSSGDGGELVDGKNRRSNLRLQESQPKSLAIEVSSSQSKVLVSVDGITVRHGNDTAVAAGVGLVGCACGSEWACADMYCVRVCRPTACSVSPFSYG
jgi:hypothetical protein